MLQLFSCNSTSSIVGLSASELMNWKSRSERLDDYDTIDVIDVQKVELLNCMAWSSRSLIRLLVR